MLFLSLFWFIRFFGVKSETLWLLHLDHYRGPGTVDLTTVTLGRDGLLSGITATLLLYAYIMKVLDLRHRKYGRTQ